MVHFLFLFIPQDRLPYRRPFGQASTGALTTLPVDLMTSLPMVSAFRIAVSLRSSRGVGDSGKPSARSIVPAHKVRALEVTPDVLHGRCALGLGKAGLGSTQALYTINTAISTCDRSSTVRLTVDGAAHGDEAWGMRRDGCAAAKLASSREDRDAVVKTHRMEKRTKASDIVSPFRAENDLRANREQIEHPVTFYPRERTDFSGGPSVGKGNIFVRTRGVTPRSGAAPTRPGTGGRV